MLALMALHLLLDPQFPFLEVLEHRIIRHWSAHFLVQLAVDTRVLELKSADVRIIH
jgi:hypothetical protein